MAMHLFFMQTVSPWDDGTRQSRAHQMQTSNRLDAEDLKRSFLWLVLNP